MTRQQWKGVALLTAVLAVAALYVWLTAGGLTAQEREYCKHVPYSVGERPMCLIVRQVAP